MISNKAFVQGDYETWLTKLNYVEKKFNGYK